MARNFLTSNNDILRWGDINDLNGVDFTIFLRVQPSTSNAGYIIGKWLSNSGYFFRRATSVNNWQFGVNTPSGGNLLEVTSSVSLDVYQNMMVTYDVSATTGTMYKNNSQIKQSTTMVSPTGNATNFCIGNRTDLARDYTGDIAEAAIWIGTALDASQRAILELTGNPMMVNVKPSFYTPLHGGAQDLIGGVTGTDVNGTTQSDHPRIYKQSAQILQFPPTAAAPAGRIMGSLAGQGGLVAQGGLAGPGGGLVS